jgi:hypothetical protein
MIQISASHLIMHLERQIDAPKPSLTLTCTSSSFLPGLCIAIGASFVLALTNTTLVVDMSKV